MPVTERLVVLTLLFALVGCQTTKVRESQKQATQSSAPARTETNAQANSPSQPVTPQSIVKDLFPVAPEKTQTVECFRSLTPEMSMYAVVQKCGRPDEEIGSGLYVFVYHLHDGSTVSISTPDLAHIGKYVSYVPTDPLLKKP
ncbi:MAG: hypothetical protein ACLPLR_00505 [Terriglobales bacterium]